MEESDRPGGSNLVAGRGDSCSYGYVVRMTGEPVGREGDHHIRIELAEQLRGEPDQDPTVDPGELAVVIVEASGLAEPELFPGGNQLFGSDCS
jgi:hypothetical protein